MLISILTVLSILTAVSSLTVVYPKVVLTVVFIPTVVYILTVVSSLSDYSPQHSPHSYFHVIFRVLKDHVLNRLMTGCCPSKSLQLRPKFHSLFLQNCFDFQKVLHLKDLNRHLECTDVSFNLENGVFSKIKM